MAQTPKYRQVADRYRDQILSGVLGAGERLPPRRQMMEESGVSRTTVDRAMDLLISEGVIQAKKRVGVVVAQTGNRGTGLEDRLASRRATGKALARNESSTITLVEMTTCPPEIAIHLGVAEGSEVLIRERVTRKNGRAVATSRSYYTREAAELTPELRQSASIPSGSRELAAERLGGTQGRAVQWVTSRLAREREIRLLELSGSVPVTQILRMVPLVDGRIVEVAVKVTDGSSVIVFHTDMSGS